MPGADRLWTAIPVVRTDPEVDARRHTMADRPSHLDHPFYRPRWRRIAIVAVTAAWTAMELLTQPDSMWAIIAGGMFVYSVWVFLITWRDREPPESPPGG